LAARTGRTQTCNRHDSPKPNALDPRRASTQQSPSSAESDELEGAAEISRVQIARYVARSSRPIWILSARPESRVHWVRPELVAEVKFLTWTEDNLLRQVVYEGLREDKPASEVRREAPRPKPDTRWPRG